MQDYGSTKYHDQRNIPSFYSGWWAIGQGYLKTLDLKTKKSKMFKEIQGVTSHHHFENQGNTLAQHFFKHNKIKTLHLQATPKSQGITNFMMCKEMLGFNKISLVNHHFPFKVVGNRSRWIKISSSILLSFEVRLI